MANVNSKSLRKEFERMTLEFETLKKAGKVSLECVTLISALLVLIELMVSIFIEKKTKKTPKNSHIPPSQTEEEDTSSSSTKTRKKSSKSSNMTSDEAFENLRTKHQTSIIPLDECQYCQTSLKGRIPLRYDKRTKIDLIFETVVTEVHLAIHDCPTCGKENRVPAPKGFEAIKQYGLGFKAFIINLLVMQMVSLKRSQDLLFSLTQQTIAQSTLLNWVKILSDRLAGWEKQAMQALLKQPCLYADETGMRVKGKTQWVHVCSGGDLVVKRLHPKRGSAAIDEIGILPNYDGVVMHDGWSSYMKYTKCQHALCGSHLLRELTFLVDAHQYRWARAMKTLLKQAARRVRESGEDQQLTEQMYDTLVRRYWLILKFAPKELPAIPERQPGQRGRIAKSDGQNLYERFVKYRTAILRFTHNSDVAFTNNRAERDIRMSKVKQKISGCFRHEEWGQYYCRISSYLQTMKNRGINPLIAIQMAWLGQIPDETIDTEFDDDS